MDISNDELEEDETQWESRFLDSAASPAPVSEASVNKKPGPPHRVILHFDLDCFYAQVEMLRNPALTHVPLGIQQKYIIVTCNYVARERGVNKLMSVTAAKEKCPELVLVKGEDLTHYREMSYKVTGAEVQASDHPRLALGSHIAAELREAIHSKVGLTGCAGIATNKLLAKLVSGTFKPNQQTALLQEDVSHVMGCLSSLRKVPGVGHQTAKRLQALGLVSVKDLQLYPLNELVREFGSPSAQRLKNLALGVDDARVTPTGAPQSLSDEDSFKKMSSTKEVLDKIQELLSSLLERMHKDGRQPQTLRLTIRRYSETNKWFSRESRQCPIPSHIGQKITSGSIEDAVVVLVPVAVKLFHKMVDRGAAFHLTLINVCFSNLQTRGAAVSGKAAITSFFTRNTSPTKTQVFSSQSQEDLSQDADGRCWDHQVSGSITTAQRRAETTPESSSGSEVPVSGFTWKQSAVVAVKRSQKETCSTAGCNSNETTRALERQVPPNVDPEVFQLLPEEIQKELLSPAYLNSLSSTSASPSVADIGYTSENKPSQPFTDSQNTEDVNEAAGESDASDRASSWSPQCSAGTSVQGETVTEGEKLSSPRSSDSGFPGNVDPKVFAELPPDIRRELMSEWRQQKPLLKTPSSRKAGRSSTGKEKDRKTAGRGSQLNNLLKYFKPS
ncbi:DNA polymerase iota isoform X2 [Cololabis saira]|uniref:DNA polymerase iota isoform X2 n=1 Tax=Cololabis saira TaxID=129043 RepID=UPI002AD3B449|nr:DNA polymerase iota isoform X2 [Cololabis saira]